MPETTPPRLTYLRIRNYRALRDVEFRDLTPLTVLIGANGSGKSTVLDALAFLGECMQGRMQDAWRERNGADGLLTNSQQGRINFDLEFLLDQVEYKYSIALNVLDEGVGAADESLKKRMPSEEKQKPLVTLFNVEHELPQVGMLRAIKVAVNWHQFAPFARILGSQTGMSNEVLLTNCWPVLHSLYEHSLVFSNA